MGHRVYGIALALSSTAMMTARADDALPTNGLVLHLDASHVVVDDGRVVAWPDQSGRGEGVAQADPARQPVLKAKALHGRPVVQFEGQAYMDGAPVLAEGDKSLTIVAVWRRQGRQGAQVICEQAADGIGRRASLLTVNDRYGFNGQNNDEHSLLPYRPGAFTLSIMTLAENGVVRLWHNDARQSSGARGQINARLQNTGATTFRVGAKAVNGAERLAGDIAEILVYDRVLSYQEVVAVGEHLGHKYSLGPADKHGTRRVAFMTEDKMDQGPDYTSRVPKFTFAETLAEQESQLRDNPLLKRFAESRRRLSADRYRPRYHYVNPEGSLNDPNGLCRWQGRWHLFYQAYPPEDPRQHWGHAVSDDLIHWRDLPYAIYPHPEEKCFSGATFVEKDRVIAMYHGTRAGNMVAISHDPLLLNWEKLTGKPVIPIRSPDGSPLPYRVFDPCVWKQGDYYYSLSAGQQPGPGGKPVRADFLLRSPDLAQWEYLHPFVEGDRFTLVGDDGACPYFWPVGDRHMLLFFSHMSGGQYLLGDYDTERDKLIATAHGYFNFGPASPAGVHAPSATPDGEGGIIVIFNMNPGYPTKGWNQIMTLPRRLRLVGEDTISIEPAGDVESLRDAHVPIDPFELRANEEIVFDYIPSGCTELQLEIEPRGSQMIELQVLRSVDGEEYTRIAFYPRRGYAHREAGHPRQRDGILVLDNSRSSILPEAASRAPEMAPLWLDDDEPLRLRVFVDRSVVEVFANDRQCLAERVYPGRDDSFGVSLRSQGRPAFVRSMDAWSMNSIYE